MRRWSSSSRVRCTIPPGTRPSRRGRHLAPVAHHFGEIAPWRIAPRSAQQRHVRRHRRLRARAGLARVHLPPPAPFHAGRPSIRASTGSVGTAPAPPAAGGTGPHRRADRGCRCANCASGWMHNRVLSLQPATCKHLRQHWRGRALVLAAPVDADWPATRSAGSGWGRHRHGRISAVNPVTQAVKFDPEGRYVARWVPELARLPMPAARRDRANCAQAGADYHAPGRGAGGRGAPRPGAGGIAAGGSRGPPGKVRQPERRRSASGRPRRRHYPLPDPMLECAAG